MRLVGRWRIVQMSGWDRDAIDLVEPGFIEFAKDRTGRFGFIAVDGWLDCRPVERNGPPGVEFTWEGSTRATRSADAAGRSWSTTTTIQGHLFFHMGDDSSFRAEPFTGSDERDRR